MFHCVFIWDVPQKLFHWICIRALCVLFLLLYLSKTLIQAYRCFFGCLSFLRCRVEVVFLSLRHISAYLHLLWFSLFLFMSTLFHVKHFYYRHFDVLGSTAQWLWTPIIGQIDEFEFSWIRGCVSLAAYHSARVLSYSLFVSSVFVYKARMLLLTFPVTLFHPSR